MTSCCNDLYEAHNNNPEFLKIGGQNKGQGSTSSVGSEALMMGKKMLQQCKKMRQMWRF